MSEEEELNNNKLDSNGGTVTWRFFYILRKNSQYNKNYCIILKDWLFILVFEYFLSVIFYLMKDKTNELFKALEVLIFA